MSHQWILTPILIPELRTWCSATRIVGVRRKALLDKYFRAFNRSYITYIYPICLSLISKLTWSPSGGSIVAKDIKKAITMMVYTRNIDTSRKLKWTSVPLS